MTKAHLMGCKYSKRMPPNYLLPLQSFMENPLLHLFCEIMHPSPFLFHYNFHSNKFPVLFPELVMVKITFVTLKS
jgi:hypothetical protein